MKQKFITIIYSHTEMEVFYLTGTNAIKEPLQQPCQYFVPAFVADINTKIKLFTK